MLVSQNLLWVLSYIAEVFKKVPNPPPPKKKKTKKTKQKQKQQQPLEISETGVYNYSRPFARMGSRKRLYD